MTYLIRTKSLLLGLTLIASLGSMSCVDMNNSKDYAYEWVDYGILNGNAPGNTLVAFGNRIIVGTDNGIQYLNVGGSNATWMSSNLSGVKITGLILHPLFPNSVIATADPNAPSSTAATKFPVYLSSDGGVTWTGVTQGLVTEGSSRLPSVASIDYKYIENSLMGQQSAHFYISLNGDAIARSVDNGTTWTIIKPTSSSISNPAGVSCFIGIVQTFYSYLYQGCDLGNDQTVIERIDLNSDTVNPLPSGTRFITNATIGAKPISGYRISFFTQGLSYALAKGGILAIVETDWRWTYQYPPSAGNDGLNTVMKAFWIDPTNLNHLVFGGYETGNSTNFSLYETYDHGKTIKFISPPSFLGLNAPKIVNSYEAGISGRNLLLLVTGNDAQNTTKTRVISRNQVDPS